MFVPNHDPATEPATAPPPDATPPETPPPPATATDRKDAAPVNTSAARKRKTGKDAVLQRARQMMRSEKRRLWRELGFEGEFSELAFEEHLQALKTQNAQPPAEAERNDGALTQLQQENQALKAQAAKLKLEHARARREAERQRQAYDNAQAEQAVHTAALRAGMADPEYGIELFKRRLRDHPPEDDTMPDIDGFFAELKSDQSRRYLFAAPPPVEDTIGAGPRSMAEQRAASSNGAGTKPAEPGQPAPDIRGVLGLRQQQQPPPTARSSGEPKPANGATITSDPATVDGMSKQEFRNYLQQNYNHRLGAG